MAGANPIRGEVSLTLGEREVVLRPTFDAIVAIETALREALPAITQAALRDLAPALLDRRNAVFYVTAQTAFHVIKEGSKAAGNPVADADIRSAIPGGLLGMAPAIVRFMVNAINGGAELEESEKNAVAAATETPATAASPTENISGNG